MLRQRPVRIFVALLSASIVASLAGWFAVRHVSRGSLAVDAAAARGSNEPEASREIFFYVLDADLIKLAMDGGDAASPSREAVFHEHPRLGALAGLMNARRREAYSLSPDVFLLLEQARPLWEPHVVERARADERGRARFDNLAPGFYWLMAEARTRQGRGDAIWNLQIRIERGETRIKLDENNALYFRPPEH